MRDSWSQNGEDIFVTNYFKGKIGNLLSIGENDGLTLSNSRKLILNDWTAHLIEPGTVYGDLHRLYKNIPTVHTHNFGISDHTGTMTFYESANHVPGGSDKGLVSSTDYAETKRWRFAGVEFTEISIHVVSWEDFYSSIGRPKFNFISIDVEGLEKVILEQMDLLEMSVECLIIEYNGNPELEIAFGIYCGMFGLKLALKNNENLIFCKP